MNEVLEQVGSGAVVPMPARTRERELVCEGACNPMVGHVDGLVRAYRAHERRAPGSGVYEPVEDPAILRQLRALRHVRHYELSAGYWACTQCGHVRRG